MENTIGSRMWQYRVMKDSSEVILSDEGDLTDIKTIMCETLGVREMLLGTDKG